MFKSLMLFITLICTLTFSSLFAGCCGGQSSCCQSVEVELGWRQDDLKWKIDHCEHCAQVKDHIHFKDINSYTISGKAKWVSSEYYIRFSAEYGTTDKGRAHELFNIKSPYLWFPLEVETSDPIKRHSEVYDFDGAVGYPFAFFCCRLSVVPLIGFSYHRQHLRVKQDEFSCPCDYYFYFDPCNHSSDFSDCNTCISSSSFFLDSCPPFRYFPASNPFSCSSSDPTIANELGLITLHRTNNYRFTWYGFYVGADFAYALDNCWTLFWYTEYHFLDNCHRKRKSWTGVSFVDDYHQKGYAYGFNNIVGFYAYMGASWYATASVDFNWWKAHSKHDELRWKKVGAKIGLAYAF